MKTASKTNGNGHTNGNGKSKVTMRDLCILVDRINGMTYKDIGKNYGMSAVRPLQIVQRLQSIIKSV